MATTEFLDTLVSTRVCPAEATRTVRRFMRTKGYPDAEPIGVYLDNQLLFYYFRLPEGILEVETKFDGGRWQRRVRDFITEKDEIHEMLGNEEGPHQAHPVFQPPQ